MASCLTKIMRKQHNVCSDASRNWYLRVKEELDKQGVKCSRFEPALFFCHFKNELQGLLTTHADDFCWGWYQQF